MSNTTKPYPDSEEPLWSHPTVAALGATPSPPSPGAPTGPSPDEDRHVSEGANTNERTTLASPAFSDAMRKVRVAEPGMVIAGKYELIELLGTGGMGQVYRARHTALGMPVAVKTMHAHIAAQPDYVRRFGREAHAVSRVDHPNVVRVTDYGDDGGLLYIVMEYLRGASLGSHLHRVMAPPPIADVVWIMQSLFEAFTVAHDSGIIHRDMKPDNVFLTDPRGEGFQAGKTVVKVVDFGLAHVEVEDGGPTLTSKDMIAGTPEYMSPEQCRSLSVGPSADLYSLGCVLTELLQLKPPFSGPSAIDIVARHMFSPPPPLKRPPESEPVPPLLERLRLDLLAKIPERRPLTAADARARLLAAVAPGGTEAHLPSRKEGDAFGDRVARAPEWQKPSPSEPARAPSMSANDPTMPTALSRRRVGLVRVPFAGELSQLEETGLDAHEISLVVARSAEDLVDQGIKVAVLDAGAAFESARERLAALTRAGLKVVVCAAELTTERINALVAGGASDVVSYPISPDALARKLGRVLRRGR